jgi:UPF0755 protein
MKQKLLLALCLIPFTFMLLAGLALKQLSQPLADVREQTIHVAKGESIYHVANTLKEQGVFAYPKLWVWYGRLFEMSHIKAGEYAVSPEMNALQLLDDMNKGKAVFKKVTLIEGWTTAEAINAIQQAEGIIATLNARDMQQVLKAVGADTQYQHYEGIFYPDTYKYHSGSRDVDILKKAYLRLDSELNAAWALRAKNLPYNNAYEALIMASIIEKETAVGEERGQIAGVFVERLNKGMRLQTDPTVIYGMGDSYDGNIRRRDLLAPTPYNTYTINGLPPTPIALATKASIQAALHPLLNGNIYFVAKGDGYHYFSKTLKEHQKAVREYQLKRKSNYRSAPSSASKAQ